MKICKCGYASSEHRTRCCKCDEPFSPESENVFSESIETIRKICDSSKHKNPIMDIMRECRRGQPKIVCLCGSTRFMEAFQRANLKETLDGKIVLSIGCNTKSDTDLISTGELTEKLKTQLDELHKRKIDLADEVMVLNVGGYIGESTRGEIEYAESNEKPVRYLESAYQQL